MLRRGSYQHLHISCERVGVENNAFALLPGKKN